MAEEVKHDEDMKSISKNDDSYLHQLLSLIVEIKTAVEEKRLALAVAAVSRWLDLYDLLLDNDEASQDDLDPSEDLLEKYDAEVEVLQHEEERVKQLVSQKLTEAFNEGSDAQILTIVSYFAPLRYQEEGLIEFYNIIQQKFVAHAQLVYESILDSQPPRKRSSNGKQNERGDADEHLALDAADERDDSDRRSCAEALTALFESVAGIIEDYMGRIMDVDLLFGPASATFFIESLQIQSDLWASRVFRHFLERLHLQELVVRLKHGTEGQESVDPRDLTDLLEEIALMSQCTEFYYRFLHDKLKLAARRKRALQQQQLIEEKRKEKEKEERKRAALTVTTEGVNQHEQTSSLLSSSSSTRNSSSMKSSSMHSSLLKYPQEDDSHGKNHSGEDETANGDVEEVKETGSSEDNDDGSDDDAVRFARASPVNAHLQEIRSYYEIFEEHFLTESLRKAMEMDDMGAPGHTSLTSLVVEYVFFVVQQSTRRALLASSVKSACAILYLLSNAIQFEYAALLRDGWRQHTRAGDLPKALVALNNVSSSVECMQAVRSQLLRDGNEAFPVATAAERERWSTSLAELQGAADGLEHLGNEFLGELLSANSRMLDSLFNPLVELDYGMLDCDQFAAYEVNEPFAHDLAFGVDELFAPVREHMLPRTHDALMGVVALAIARRLEQCCLMKKFNPLGGVLLNSQIHFLLEHFDSQCSEPTQKISTSFLRMQQMASVLMCESVDEVLNYYADQLLASLSPHDLAACARLKTNLTPVHVALLEARLAKDSPEFAAELRAAEAKEAEKKVANRPSSTFHTASRSIRTSANQENGSMATPESAAAAATPPATSSSAHDSVETKPVQQHSSISQAVSSAAASFNFSNIFQQPAAAPIVQQTSTSIKDV